MGPSLVSGWFRDSAMKLTLRSRFLPASPSQGLDFTGSYSERSELARWPVRAADGNVVTCPLWDSPTCCRGSSSLKGHDRPVSLLRNTIIPGYCVFYLMWNKVYMLVSIGQKYGIVETVTSSSLATGSSSMHDILLSKNIHIPLLSC
jgi:hypothetical protein